MQEGQRRFVEKTRQDLEAGSNATIVAFGDSITAGFAVRRGFPSFWRERLEQKFPEAKVEMINSGISGDTSPDLVTINFGINDAVLDISLDEFKVNLIRMIRRIRSGPNSEILLLSSQPLETPPYDRIVQDYYRAVEDVAREMEVGFVDVYGAWMERVRTGTPLGSLIIPGLDHPNEAGYRIIAEELMRLF
jgi:lysophospholipase L1-like esterase